MIRRAARCCLIAAVLAVFCGPAWAKPWIIDYAHSRIGFSGMQGDMAFQGAFKSFKADVDFDPAHPETGKIAATIAIAGVSTGDGQRDALLPQSNWFDVDKFPQAQFVSSYIRKTGADSYAAQGALTIKGITKQIILPFTLKQEGDHWRALGKTALIRNDFHIGIGQWADPQTVGPKVNVTVDLMAKPGT
jgi:polyisoprenoid-binding protein YceI